VAAVSVWVFASLPPRSIPLPSTWDDGTVRGILHVHSNRSDGRSSPEVIAAAAARAGLEFVVISDHGDATRVPDPPLYRDGVLCIDAVEISTTGGHYLALGLPVSPYPLGGEPRDVVDDVRWMGGFGIAAHPDSPKDELRWRDWNAPFDGVEIVNPDTSWRLRAAQGGWRGRRRLAQAFLTYPFRAPETIASLLTASPALMDAWSAELDERRVVGIAGVDAHAKLALRAADPGDNRLALPVPGYLPVFRAMSVHVAPSEPFTGDAAADATRLLAGIRDGRVYTAIDAWASPAAFELTATNRSGTAKAGETLAADGALTLRVRTNAPPQFETRVLSGGSIVDARPSTADFSLDLPGTPAVYRVEIGRPDPGAGPAWLTSNPVYVRAPDRGSRQAATRSPEVTGRLPLFDDRQQDGWTVERDPTALVALDVVRLDENAALRIRYGLAGGPKAGQYGGAGRGLPDGIADYDRLAFSARSSEPMRISVQVRANMPGGSTERWQRSVRLGPSEQDYAVRFDDMRPIGATAPPAIPLASAQAILFIVDTTNTKPGSSGRVWLEDIRLERVNRD
jgi:hypothetical protein